MTAAQWMLYLTTSRDDKKLDEDGDGVYKAKSLKEALAKAEEIKRNRGAK